MLKTTRPRVFRGAASLPFDCALVSCLSSEQTLVLVILFTAGVFMRLFILGFVGLVAMVPGCATITRGASEAWVVDSDPAGANVKLSTGQECVTPCALKLKRKRAFTVTMSKPGFKTVETQVLSEIAGAGAAGMAGNVVFGGVIGVVVDASSGATKQLKPNPLSVSLEAE